MKRIGRSNDVVACEIANVEHADEVVGADLPHWIKALPGDGVGTAREQVSGFDELQPSLEKSSRSRWPPRK